LPTSLKLLENKYLNLPINGYPNQTVDQEILQCVQTAFHLLGIS